METSHLKKGMQKHLIDSYSAIYYWVESGSQATHHHCTITETKTRVVGTKSYYFVRVYKKGCIPNHITLSPWLSPTQCFLLTNVISFFCMKLMKWNFVSEFFQNILKNKFNYLLTTKIIICWRGNVFFSSALKSIDVYGLICLLALRSGHT